MGREGGVVPLGYSYVPITSINKRSEADKRRILDPNSMIISRLNKKMDKYSEYFRRQTGLSLCFEEDAKGVLVKAVADDGKCCGTRYFSASLKRNQPLVQASIEDLISQVRNGTSGRSDLS